MSGTKPPVILLVPGAFSTPNCFAKLVPFLNEAGYSTYPGPYPSYDSPDPGSATCQHDIDSLRSEVLLPLLDQEEKDVVILAHSYGGVVAGGAAYGLDKYSRQKHAKMTGIIGLIYVVGNIVLEGESLVEGSGGAFPPFMKVDQVTLPLNDDMTIKLH
jgi:alpha-beta hydrolase superfamily lysophospholipase